MRGVSPSGHDGPDVLPARMTPAQIRSLGIAQASYPPFRETFFFDPRANTALKKGGRPPDRLVYARESRRMWSSHGPSIDPRLPRTTVKPGTAFRNECLSADQLYSSNRNSLGYDVHRTWQSRGYLLVVAYWTVVTQVRCEVPVSAALRSGSTVYASVHSMCF